VKKGKWRAAQKTALTGRKQWQLDTVAAHRFEELVAIDRFLKVFRSAQDRGFLLNVAQGGNDHHGDGSKGRIFFLYLAKAPAVHPGHHQIKKDEVGSFEMMEPLKSIFPVGGRRDHEPVAAKDKGHHLPEQEVIFNE
jgi:hypothetical protein